MPANVFGDYLISGCLGVGSVVYAASYFGCRLVCRASLVYRFLRGELSAVFVYSGGGWAFGETAVYFLGDVLLTFFLCRIYRLLAVNSSPFPGSFALDSSFGISERAVLLRPFSVDFSFGMTYRRFRDVVLPPVESILILAADLCWSVLERLMGFSLA
jgi:hypothetical protein